MTPPIATGSSRAARWFVWAVWAGMVAIALWHFAHYARNLPLAEDWDLVAPLTGHQPDLGRWFWSQNNEHRLPLPRLMMLGLLKASGGDFRAGMLFSIIAVAGLAAAMIEVARRRRNGRTRYTDAFFPILLLEVGDWQNLFWTWQLSFVVSVLLASIALLAIVRRPGLDTPGVALATGAALILAPLSGGTGLVFVPPLLLYAGWQGVRLARAEGSPSERRAATILIASAALTIAVIGLYFVGYERPSWIPRNPGLGKSLVTALQFQTYGLGPAVRTSWTLWGTIANLLLLAATARVVFALRAPSSGNRRVAAPWEERQRAWGLLACLMSVAGVAAGMGYGRAAVLDVYNGWPDRYVLLAAPAFCIAYFAWELTGHDRVNRFARATLFALAALLLPLNTAFGREWGSWYVGGMDRVMRDIQDGVPPDVLADRHREFLIHFWDAGRLEAHMQMLHDAGIGPFRAMRVAEDTTPSSLRLDSLTLRYHLPEAGAVSLVWGIDGWQRVPASIRPSGTVLTRSSNAMSSPMRREEDGFTATLAIPRGSSLDYGFVITARNDHDSLSALWDGNRRYEPNPASRGVVDADPGLSLLTNPLQGGDTVLVMETIRYGPTDARRVRIVWGIAGWQRLPPGLYPPRTRTSSLLMTTTMQQDGPSFTAALPVPAGRRLDFAFQLDRGDRFDVNDNNYGRNYGFTAVRDSSITVESRLTIAAGSGLLTVLWIGMVSLLGLAGLAGLSALIVGRMTTAAR